MSRGVSEVVVVPAPAFAQTRVVLHRRVGYQASADGVDAHLLQTLCKGPHVVVVESGVHAAYAVEVASEDVAIDEARII